MAVNAIKALTSRPLLAGLGLGLLTLLAAGIKIMKKNKLPDLGVVPASRGKRAWFCDGYRNKGELRWPRKTQA